MIVYQNNFCTARVVVLMMILIIFNTSFCFHIYSQTQFAFISDTQKPISIERLWNKQWDRKERNVEARDALLDNIVNEEVSTIFFLGDLVGIGSREKQWLVIDDFLNKCNERRIGTYAIPGNHEYLIFPKIGINKFYKRFPEAKQLIQTYVLDSVAIVMLNTNFTHLSKYDKKELIEVYESTLDTLQKSSSVVKIIVCTHQAPFANSKKIESDKDVQKLLVPHYLSTPKAILFLSGHSHNLEYFHQQNKHFMVIGGGGGIFQDLKKEDERLYESLIVNEGSIRYFYALVSRNKEELCLIIKGFNADDFNKIFEKKFAFK